MITRKKATVHWVSLLDGKQVNAGTATRNVYRIGDKWWVYYMGGRRGREATENPDGSFQVVYRVVTLTGTTMVELMKRIKRNAS